MSWLIELAKCWLPAIISAGLLTVGIAAFVVGSIPYYSTTSRYLSFSEINVDVIVDAEHTYLNTIATGVEDKIVFNLTTNNRFVDMTLSLGSNTVYAENFIDKLESEFPAPSKGTYYLTVNASQPVTVNGTVSVMRLTTTATATALYIGLGLASTIFSSIFIFYTVYLHLESVQTVKQRTGSTLVQEKE